MVQTKVNMAEKDYPLFSFFATTGSFSLNRNVKYFHDVSMRYNSMVIHDKAGGFGGPGGATTLNFFDTQ